MRAPGAGPEHDLPFTDRVIVTLVTLRFQLPHAALAELYRVHRSTVTRAVGEVRPLLAARGFAVPGEPCGVPKPRSRLLTCSFLKRPADPPAARQASGLCEVHDRYSAGTHPARVVTAVPHRD